MNHQTNAIKQASMIISEYLNDRCDPQDSSATEAMKVVKKVKQLIKDSEQSILREKNQSKSINRVELQNMNSKQ